ncbi:MAG: hypothetical protein ACRDKB_00015 [Actinomycetota bacterium]
MGLSRKRRTRIIGAVLFAGVLAAGTYAFTAANTVAASKAGDGSNTITGYTVSNVKYNLDATDPSKVSSYEFDLDATARQVKAKIVSGSTVYESCTVPNVLSPNHWLCTPVTPPTVTSADQLRVIATQ